MKNAIIVLALFGLMIFAGVFILSSIGKMLTENAASIVVASDIQ